MHKYYALYKPFGTISQFSASGDKPTLAEIANVNKDVYPVGRLDTDSEGLLLLTNDKQVNNRLLNPKSQHWRSYFVQVDGQINQEATQAIESGLEIKVKGKTHFTLPCKCAMIPDPELPERDPPIRFRKNIPTSWIRLDLHEGKNRQVRKMTAAVGFPTLRLVRFAMEEISIEGMVPGEIVELDRQIFFQKLHLF